MISSSGVDFSRLDLTRHPPDSPKAEPWRAGRIPARGGSASGTTFGDWVKESLAATRGIKMLTLDQLEQEISQLKERNQRVEADKGWETSYTRRILLVLFTYLAIGIYLRAINIPGPWLNAIVPAVAFMLSTLTLPFFKKLWLKYSRKR